MRSSLSFAALNSSREKRRPLPEIFEEIVIEILIKLPVKSLMRFKCVSKLWLSLICSRYFTNLLLKLRPSRRRFFAYIHDAKERSNSAWFTSSPTYCYSGKSVSVINLDLTLPSLGESYIISAAPGLVCFGDGEKVRICNLHTRQVVELPVMKSELMGDNNSSTYTYIGYNHVHDEYKVLCVVCEICKPTRVVRSECLVFVLGAGASWRKIQCHVPHYPFGCSGITINGVLYYKAFTHPLNCVLMSFDLTSEEFRLTQVPIHDGMLWIRKAIRTRLINFQGTLAFLDPVGNTMDVSVLEDTKRSQWSEKKTFVLPHSQLRVMGAATRSGQVLLKKVSTGTPNQPESSCLIIYDLERNEITQSIEMCPLPDSFKMAGSLIFFDDIENIMYLET